MTEQKAVDSITLKWGTLKGWDLHTQKARDICQKYLNSGVSMSVAMQRNTLEQKQLLLELIDASNAETIYLDWDDKHVSKSEAKEYIVNYGTRKETP